MERDRQIRHRHYWETSEESDLNRAEMQTSESMATTQMRKRGVYLVTAICLLTASLMAIAIGSIAVKNAVQGSGKRDFVEYWAAGTQLIHQVLDDVELSLAGCVALAYLANKWKAAGNPSPIRVAVCTGT
jgi:hypothetical protein